MRRRSFITLICAAASWPVVGRAEQKRMPMIGVLSGTSPGPNAANVAALQQALSETGYVEGQTVAIEYRGRKGFSTGCPLWRAISSRKKSL